MGEEETAFGEALVLVADILGAAAVAEARRCLLTLWEEPLNRRLPAAELATVCMDSLLQGAVREAVQQPPPPPQPQSQPSQQQRYRDRKRADWLLRRRGKRVVTLADLEASRVAEERGTAAFEARSRRGVIRTLRDLYNPREIGMRAVELTNDYRQTQHRPALAWNAALAAIATEHSAAMAAGKVPFGHDGFAGRTAKFPFGYSQAAENVAMNHGVGDVAKVAVDGWIKSPGHNKNLISSTTDCGIGVAQAKNGAWYLTQLFASRR